MTLLLFIPWVLYSKCVYSKFRFKLVYKHALFGDKELEIPNCAYYQLPLHPLLLISCSDYRNNKTFEFWILLIFKLTVFSLC